MENYVVLMTQLDKNMDSSALQQDAKGRAEKVLDSVDRLNVPNFVTPKDLILVNLF